MKIPESFRRQAPMLALSLALPMLWLTALRLCVLDGGENCYDAYYHAAMADAGPGKFLSRTMPSMTMSVWETQFSDKEALYHMALWAMRKGGLALGLDGAPPFHIPALAFSTALVAAFIFALRRCGVHDTLLPSIALVVASPFFTNRLLMLRPHVLSMTIMLLSIPAFAKASGKKGYALLFAIGLLYSWSYSNPHFILLPAACFFAARLGEGFAKAAAPGLCALGGVIAGLILHPQFPNTLANWKIQCVDVALNSLLPGATPIKGSVEMGAPGGLWLAGNTLVYGLFAFSLALSVSVRMRDGLDSLSKSSQAVFAASALAVAGTMFNIRVMEYACPLSVFAAALLVADLRRLPAPPRGFDFSGRARLWTATLLVLAALAGAAIHSGMKRSLVAPCGDFAQWIRGSGIPAGETLANITWSDFTILYFPLPDYRYLCGLDPMFAYSRFPERFSKLESFRLLDSWMEPAELAKATGARYAFVHEREWILGRSMKLRGYKAVYEGKDGWLFALDPKRSEAGK